MRLIATACALVAFMGAVAFAYTRFTDKTVKPVIQHVPPSKRKPLKISGQVAGLTPGATTVLEVKIRNNLKHRIRLRSLQAIVGDASAACPGELLLVPPLRTTKALRARRTRRVKMQVTMLSSATNACQSAKFPVRYKARFRYRPHAH